MGSGSQAADKHNIGTSTLTEFQDNGQQLQRIEILHEQLKLEAIRAQDFLAQIRRKEVESRSAPGTHTINDKQGHQPEKKSRDIHNPSPGQITDHMIASTNGNDVQTATKSTSSKLNVCTCSRSKSKAADPIQPHPKTDSSCVASSSKLLLPEACNLPCCYPLRQAEAELNRLAKDEGLTIPPFTLPTKIDEKEVRDLEKRVRGLEGRVRGFQGLPPDRDIALMEVERLRKELEGLARKREGLFEGLDGGVGLSLGLSAAAAKLDEVLSPTKHARKARLGKHGKK